METCVIAETTNVVIATSWKALLDGAGIEAEMVGADAESVFDGLSPTIAAYRILVAQDDAARARELIDAAEADAMAADEPRDE